MREGSSPSRIITQVLDCSLKGNKFVLQLSYYIHFQINTFGKGMNPFLPPPSHGLNRITVVLLQGWVWHRMTHKG